MASWPEFRVIKSGVQSNKLGIKPCVCVWIDFYQDKSGLTLVKTKWLDKMVGQNDWSWLKWWDKMIGPG